MSQKRRPAPSPQGRPTTASQFTSTTVDLDIAKRVADQVDWSIWKAVYEGQFRLAVRCKVCNRWLTAGPSKRARVGAHCAAKAAAEVTAR